jgi:hypothetical protein
MLDRRSSLVCFLSLLGSLAITNVFSEPFQKRRAKQHQLKSLGAFAVAFDANGSVSSARFRHSIAPGFSEACGKLQVVDLKGALGIGQSLQVLSRLESLRMVVLSLSDVMRWRGSSEASHQIRSLWLSMCVRNSRSAC